MNRKAVLVFAHPIRVDLVRRGLPDSLRPLLDFRASANGVDADVHLFTSGPAATAPDVCVHQQRGNSFAERIERAAEEIAALGYEQIVLIGRDCPSLEGSDITHAFAELATNRLVLGPDHRGGCYLIALRAGDRDLLRGIRWNRNSDCAELCGRCPESCVFLLAQKQDIDSWADLRFFARLGGALSSLAGFLLRILCTSTSGTTNFVDLAAHFVRVRGQMPPPAFAG